MSCVRVTGLAGSGFSSPAVMAAFGFLAASTFVSLVQAAPLQRADGTTVERSRTTGLATFVIAPRTGAFVLPIEPGKAAADPVDFFKTDQGKLFGVTDPSRQLLFQKRSTDSLGFTHTTYKQMHQGMPVFSGVLKVHQNAMGAVTSANGDFYPIRNDLVLLPTITPDTAAANARARITEAQIVVDSSELVIVDPGWYGDPPRGARLAYHIILASAQPMIREAFFIDAHSGEVLDQWTLLETVRNREVYDAMGTDTLGVLARAEGQLSMGNAEVDRGYDYAGDTYDYFFRAHDRDSTNDAGLTMTIVVNSTSPPCPNAFGGGGQATHCTGTASDDVVAHEFMHSITGFSAGLIYQNQSGQLNEAMSDIFGELIDLYNGNVSLPGAAGGTPWPTHGTGPGTDSPNNLRTQCSVPPGAFLTVNSPVGIAGDYFAGFANFGPPLTALGTTGNLVVATPALACDGNLPFTNPPGAFTGRIALVDRGICPFAEKVLNVQDAGAIGAIVVNNIPGAVPFNMGGGDPLITIPSLMISFEHGELLKNTPGTINVTLRDAPNGLLDGVRWLAAEDATAFGAPIRDMWNPTCKGHPDRANSPLQTCGGINGDDNGGVHSGSGVMNHAFAIMTDGKNFNGFNVTAIGPIKAGAVIYRALTEYMTSATDFKDAYTAINLAADDLVGTIPDDPRTGAPSASMFTAADAVEVDEAMLAVELNTDGACGANQDVLTSVPPTECNPQASIYFDNFEGGVNGWTLANSGPLTPYDWVQVSDLPFNRPGTAWFCDDPSIGDCNVFDESGVHYLTSPVINLPANLGETYVKFTHYLASEPQYDGGVVSFDDGGGTFIPFTNVYFTYNQYNTTLNDAGSGNTNPLAGLEAFSGSGGQWGTTLIRLSEFEGIPTPLTIRIRFEFGKDGCTGVDGWYVDDFEVYECVQCATDADCDDNNACTCDACLVTELGERACGFATSEFGNVDCSFTQQPNLDDILCGLAGFSNFGNCPNADIAPTTGPTACQGNNVINLDDLLALLAAFGGADPCGC